MELLVTAAERRGVTLAIENHSKSLIDSPDSLRYLAEFSKSPHLGIALAPYHLPQDERLIARLVTDLGAKLVHFYAWEHGQGGHQMPKRDEMKQMPGYGQFDFTPLLAALRDIDYRGWTEIFMHPFPRGFPILESTAEVTAAINRSRAYLKERLKDV